MQSEKYVPEITNEVKSPARSVEEYGVATLDGPKSGLRRSLFGRHIAMIAIASGIGTGLFLGTGNALATAGPLGILIGYALMGLAVAEVSFISAETTGFLPLSGGFQRFVPRFTDKAMGLASGYSFVYLLSITAPAEVVAASSLISYWRPDLNLAIFISVFLVLILAFNLGPARFYGETEFVFGLMKCLLIVGLIIAGLLVDWGVNPTNTFIGGRNWHPSPVKEYLVSGATGRFLAIWNTLINAAFALGNIQIATSAAGEVKNPRLVVPMAMRRVFYRIFFFYIISLLVVGLVLNSSNPNIGLLGGTAGSPFVIAFQSVQIKVLPSIINAVVITSAFSSGNGVLFTASRTLYGIAADGYAPAIFLRTNRFGTPYVAVLVPFAFSLLAYLECGNDTAATVFNWFINLISTQGLIIWCVICFAYVRFYYGMKTRGISRDELPYKSWGQPWAAIAAGFFCFLITFFSGFAVFFPGHWSASNFLSNYIACFIFPVLYIIFKLTTKSPWVSYEMMDFSEMDEIRAWRVSGEAQAMSARPIWRRFLGKFTDD